MGLPTDLARELLDEDPTLPSKTAGRILHKRHEGVYASEKAAYNTVLRIRGACGKSNRTTPTHRRDPADAETCKRWGALIPEPDSSGWKTEDLPTGPQKWLVLSDVHIPYYDKTALVAALEHGDKEKCDGVLLNGDIIDAYQLSTFARDPRLRDFAGEMQMLGQFFDALSGRVVIWKQGNHEQRLERYLMQRAPELFGIPQFTYRVLLDLDRRGVQLIAPMNPVRIGKLGILHGHELPKGISNPVNPARGAFLRALSCVLIGHYHRTSDHTEQTFDGVTITAWSTGCLCDLNPQYAPINKWNHGFAILHTPRGESWRVENKRIIAGEVV